VERSADGRQQQLHQSGFLGGGQVGVNAQFNALVVGVEGDFT